MSKNSMTILVQAAVSAAAMADDVGTAFTAQAVLNDGGEAVNNPVDIQATLFDEEEDGFIMAGPIQIDAVNVVNGVLTWEMDFGGDVFNGQARFIELAVRNPHDPTDTAPFTLLDQRVRITPTPETIHALHAAVIDVPATLTQDDAGVATLTVENTAGVGSTALAVGGDADVTGNVSTGPLAVAGSVNALGAVNGTDVIATANLSAGANLSVTADGTVGGQWSVNGNTTLNADLGVTGDTTLGGLLDVTGNTTVNADLAVTGDTTLTGNLTTQGSADLANGVLVVDATEATVQITDRLFVGSDVLTVDQFGAHVGDGVLSAGPTSSDIMFRVESEDGSIITFGGGNKTFSVDGPTGDTNVRGTFSVGTDPLEPLITANQQNGFEVGLSDSPSCTITSIGSIIVSDNSTQVFFVDSTNGDTYVAGNLELDLALLDGVNNSPGASGQILSSTGTATEWRDLIVGDLDMKGKALINIGSKGSAFSPTGELILEDDLIIGPTLLGGLFEVDADTGDVDTAGSLFVGGLSTTFSVNGVDGSFFSTGDANVKGAYHDSSDPQSSGSLGQILSSTVTGTKWINHGALEGDSNIAGNLSVGGSTTLGDAATDTTTISGSLRVNNGPSLLGDLLSVDVLLAHIGTEFVVGTDPADPLMNVKPALGEVSVLGKLFAGKTGSETHEVLGVVDVRPNDDTPATISMDGPTGDLHVKGAYHDSGDLPGAAGQILSSLGTGTQWIAAPTGGVDSNGNLVVPGNTTLGDAPTDLVTVVATFIEVPTNFAIQPAGSGTPLIEFVGADTVQLGTGGSSFGSGGGLNLIGDLDIGNGNFTVQASTGITEIRSAFHVVPGGDQPVFSIGTDGSFSANGDASINGSYNDSLDDPGTAGQLLSSTGTGTQWVDCDCGGGGGASCVSCSNGDATVDGTLFAADVNADSSFIEEMVGAEVLLSSATNQIAIAAFGFSTDTVVDLFNFNGVGKALDTFGDAHIGGDLAIDGVITKGGGTFKIDHPLDPMNRYLSHSFVESPDMMNIYNGNVLTDATGYAVVFLPDWFEALNQEFRYQLTVIDEADGEDFVQAKVVRKIEGNQFVVRTSAAHVEVSWQVTGIRHDAFAETNRVQVEEWKHGDEQGKLLHPEAFGMGPEAGIHYEKVQRALDRQAQIEQQSKPPSAAQNTLESISATAE